MPDRDLKKLPGPIAVLMGGTASERNISLQSGAAVHDALCGAGYACVAIDTAADDVIDVLRAAQPAFAFIAVHGAGGEDGKLQALLELLEIPYSGSGVLGSALAMDKLRSKQIWQALGLSTPQYRVYAPRASSGENYYEETLAALGGRVFVKPVSEGSSFGMAVASSATGLREACAQAAEFGQEILVERAIDGDEYTLAIIDRSCLPSIRIETARHFYDFDAKYVDDDTRFLIPSGLSKAAERELGQLCLTAFDALGCSGWGRVDVMRCASSGEFFLLEANTVPGLTDHSLVPMAASAAGYSFLELLEQIIRQGLRNIDGERAAE